MGNFLGNPGYSLPVGYGTPDASTSHGRHGSGKPVPIGLHFLGRHWDEDHLLRLAHSLEVGYMKGKELMPPVFFDPFK
jgi:Asp-tRNA(Asn)/Glu-tRNA(Gln) amidotransferase A subunit family amidase